MGPILTQETVLATPSHHNGSPGLLFIYCSLGLGFTNTICVLNFHAHDRNAKAKSDKISVASAFTVDVLTFCKQCAVYLCLGRSFHEFHTLHDLDDQPQNDPDDACSSESDSD